MKSFTSKPADRSKPVDFELDGEHYIFNPPKQSTQLVSLLQVKGQGTVADIERVAAMFSWLGTGLNRDHEPRKGKTGHTEMVDDCQACKIQARLEDQDDDLEIEEVLELITWLMGEVAGRPTT